MSHQAKIPTVAVDYFGWHTEHPVVRQVFRPDRGWTRYPWRKRVSGNEVRKLRAEGVTAVQLASDGRLADFDIIELSRR